MRSAVLGIVVLLVPLRARADGDPPNLRVEVASGVTLDWTTLQLEVTSTAHGTGTEDTEAVEQLARRDVDAAMRQGARRVRLTAAQTVAELDGDRHLGPAVAARMARWTVSESRYFASGKVELVAGLGLQDLLKPWTLQHADPFPEDAAEVAAGTGPTGLLVDARQTDAVPGFGPRVLDGQGGVLWDGALWEEAAVAGVPVIYVTDPAHPAASVRAGARPVVVHAERASGPDLVLGSQDTAHFRAALTGSTVLGQGTVVIVLAP